MARGIDPREFALVPFGGAGPLHGVALAEAIAAKEIIVPVAPGITAAMGLLQTDMQYEHARSLIVSLKHVDQAAIARINAVIDELVERCRRDLEKDGVKPERQKFQKLAECRYHGQGFELRASLPDGKVTTANLGDVVTGFHQQHRLDYGYHFDDGEVELITIRVIGREDVVPLPANAPLPVGLADLAAEAGRIPGVTAADGLTFVDLPPGSLHASGTTVDRPVRVFAFDPEITREPLRAQTWVWSNQPPGSPPGWPS